MGTWLRQLVPPVINLSFALYHGILGVLYHSVWFGALGMYYALLTLLRVCALRPHRRPSLFLIWTGVCLMVLSGVLAVISYLSISRNLATRHEEILMITIATYTFYKIVMAILRAARQRHTATAAEEAVCRIRLVEVAVSLFAMQRSMLVSFGDIAAGDVQLLNSLTGGGVFLFILIQGISLIWKGGIPHGKKQADQSQ